MGRPENTERNQHIVDLVRGGFSYADAAESMGVTRQVVAGVCYRAGLKVGKLRHLSKAIRAHTRRKLSEGQRRRWANRTGAERAAMKAKVQATWRQKQREPARGSVSSAGS